MLPHVRRYLLSDAVLPYDPSWYGWIPKMALNQTIWAFTWNVIYIMLAETMQGKSAKQALRIVSRPRAREREPAIASFSSSSSCFGLTPSRMTQVDKMWWPLQLEGW